MDEYLLRQLSLLNEFWQNRRALFHHENTWPKRDEFVDIIDKLELSFIQALMGIRRVGKTTLLRQMINHLLTENNDSKKILYFAFDKKIFQKREMLEKILDYYWKQILKKENFKQVEKCYIFLDEVHYVDDWQGVLKSIYDHNKNIKFIVSGSGSLFIRKKSHESLSGRIIEHHIGVLNFKEYLKINYSSIYKEFKTVDINNIEPCTFEESMLDIFEEYLMKGQFPELSTLLDTKLIFELLENQIISKSIEYDIPELFDIRDAFNLRILYEILTKDTGNIYNITNLASQLEISRNTVYQYIDIFKQCYLLDDIGAYVRTDHDIKKTTKKVYSASTNLVCALYNAQKGSELFEKIKGHLVETYVHLRLKQRYKNIFFFKKDHNEVDFIIDQKTQSRPIIPLEVKYTNTIRSGDYRFLLSVMEHFNCQTGILLTKNVCSTTDVNGEKLLCIPVMYI